MKQISVNQLDQKWPILDVREVDEFSQGHLAGACNLPLSEFESWAAQLDPKETYQILCHSGNRSQMASMVLARAGFSVVNVSDGMMAYKGATVNEL
ncbi:rhodanese-like domain-containing protein [Enterococcus canis]|uniref:rhodanese-like domain-containing protein n=1 Tax=Enterococcus canis TaxID=214095 RepID=UPI00082EDF66|nr:rhodanese-like domain-containing protein [Enterococcus canis]